MDIRGTALQDPNTKKTLLFIINDTFPVWKCQIFIASHQTSLNANHILGASEDQVMQLLVDCYEGPD